MISRDCPICKLNPDEVDKMSEDEAGQLVTNLEEQQKWCLDHFYAYTELAQRYSFIAKNWLREIIQEGRQTEKVEA